MAASTFAVGGLLVYSLSSAVGQNFIYYTVTEFGPLVLTTVTTTRKIFSTLYSVFRNPANSLSQMQWGGCILVFAGLLLDVLAKYGGSGKKAAPSKETEMKPVATAPTAAHGELATSPQKPSRAGPSRSCRRATV